jgi:hypothetical protein
VKQVLEVREQLPTIGFAIMSHADPAQLQRLIAGLNEHYDDPPIACHHDFSQRRLDTGSFPANVGFVEPSRKTGWGRLSVVKAGLDAIALLCEQADPDWFFLLSAADYPIMPAAAVRRELAQAECDAFADIRPLLPDEVGSARLTGRLNPKLNHFDSDENKGIKRRFYRSPQFWMPIIRFSPRLRPGKFTYRPHVDSPFHPYRDGIACYYGDHWFTANRRAAATLLTDSPLREKLFRHLRTRTQTDETFYLTMLANNPELTVCRDNRRFAEWNGGGAHPMFLTEAQLPEAFASGSFFARKFAVGSPLLDGIDERLRFREPLALP